jgi:hypothetical protein
MKVDRIRLERAQRALFEAMGQLSILAALVEGMREAGDWSSENRPKPLTVAGPEARIGDERRVINDELQDAHAARADRHAL